MTSTVLTIQDDDPFEKPTFVTYHQKTVWGALCDLIDNLTPSSLLLFWIIVQILFYILTLTIVVTHLSALLKFQCYRDFHEGNQTCPHSPAHGDHPVEHHDASHEESRVRSLSKTTIPLWMKYRQDLERKIY
ncbi:unnamed protein product [Phyllotreta striolata]|uniref:Uncharacterized protein n=1 Tax=Phyllotreta striolata TaxID=444603 RepID=A0A9N9XMV8_PHYSR|nr:unnamed protein product [Phyllotreta striolata]